MAASLGNPKNNMGMVLCYAGIGLHLLSEYSPNAEEVESAELLTPILM